MNDAPALESQLVEEAYKVGASDNLVYGPVGLPDLLEWVKDQRILPDTWIHTRSDDSWEKAGRIPALSDAFREASQAGPGPQVSMAAGEEIGAEELRQFPRLARLPDRQLEQVRRFGELCLAPPRSLILRRGDVGDALYLVLAGEVRVRLLVGMEDKTLATIRPGQFFGEMALFNDSPRSADVVAVTTTRLMRVTQQAFRLLIEEIPELAGPILYQLATAMADRLVAANAHYQQDKAAEFLWR